MAVDHLEKALKAVDWNKNVVEFLKNANHKEKLTGANMRLALWSKQLEQIDKGNPALSFIREMQSSGQHVAALVSLALYKPASGSIRTIIETALYYTYFRTHAAELTTLQRDRDYYITKEEILDYHKRHSQRFSEYQAKLGLLAKLRESYKTLSAILHGQIPGKWTHKTNLSEIGHNDATCSAVINSFEECAEIIHRLFLCTIAPSHWDDFNPMAKKALLKGMSGEDKLFLKLDEK